jgi:hypothetical protein
VFFAHQVEDLEDKNRHITLSPRDMSLLNPNTRTCPIFRSRREAELTKAIYRHVPVLIDRSRESGGNPWAIRFVRMFDQTNDAALFQTSDQLEKSGCKSRGAIWTKGRHRSLPLYEAKMFRSYDHRFGSVYIKSENWLNQGQTIETSVVEHQNPEFTVLPRWWVSEAEVLERFGVPSCGAILVFRNVTRATDTRTVIASFIPLSGVINSAPIIAFESPISPGLQCCLLADLNSFVLDYVAKRKIPNVNLNFFVVEQLPILPPDFYSRKCPWEKRASLEKWISERVLKLTCVSNDMKPLAEAARFKPLVYRWDPGERAQLQAELDAAFFLLYEIDRPDVEYILSTFSGVEKEAQSLLSGGSTREQILACYDRFRASLA